MPALAAGRTAAACYRLKNAIKASEKAAAAAAAFAAAAEAASAGKALRSRYGKEIAVAAVTGVQLVGDPVVDWRAALTVLAGIPILEDVLQQVRLFRATDALTQGLADMWVGSGSYRGAAVLVKKMLDQERLLSAELEPQGCVVMNIHKSKGKEFDGVVLVEGQFKAHFFDERSDPPPSPHARRLLRVAITRARRRVVIIRSQGAAPPLVTA